MAGFDTTAASDILKNLYLPPVQEMLNNATILLNKLEKDSTATDVSGKNATVPVHYGRNLSAGLGVSESGILPDAYSQVYKTAVVPYKLLYGKIQVSGPVIAATKNTQGAFVKAIESEMKGLTKDFKKALNRQLHGDGYDALGYLAEACNSSGGETISKTIDDGTSPGVGFSHLSNGQAIPVDIINPSGGASRITPTGGYPTMQVTAVGATTQTVSIVFPASTSAASTADGDIIIPAVKTATSWATSKTKQMMGIKGIVSAADPGVLGAGLHGLGVSSYPWWAAQVVGSDTSKVDLSFANLQKVFSLIASNSDGSEDDISLLLTSYGVRDKYVELCIQERRFINEMKLDGGFKAVSHNGKPIVADSQCWPGRIYFLNFDTLSLFRLQDFAFMEKDGSVWSRVGNVDAYEATLTLYADLGCKIRNQNGVLVGINQ